MIRWILCVSRRGLVCFRVSVRDGVAYPLPKSASHMLSSLAAATHCAVLDDSSVRGSAHEVGARVPVIPVL